MEQYQELLEKALNHGVPREDRTGTGTRSLFGHHMRFDLRDGFPLVTTKKLHTRSIIHELLWFLRGDTQVSSLQEVGVSIWDEWATEEQCARFGRKAGDLGPVYGHQWRNFGASKRDDGSFARDGFDQLSWVIAEIKRNPTSRRLIVSGWNPREAEQVALPPCHTLFQFYVQSGGLHCQLYQRSADIFLGLPFNIASYALLTHLVAATTGLEAHSFCHCIGDAHLYNNHQEQAKTQLERSPRPLPKLHITKRDSIFDYRFEDIVIENYDPHPAIRAEVAV